MVAGVIAQKSDQWFNLADVNGNGYIEEDDLRQLAERTLTHFGYSKESPKWARLHEAYVKAWQIMYELTDTDKDNRISRTEFQGYMDRNAKPSTADGLLRPITDAEFDVADTDNDGYLSQDEYAELLRAFGLSTRDARTGARSIDTDSDGRISHEEYFVACRDLYSREAADDRSSQVFGPLTRT
ncbi:EF-hand domain-containing protein [Streptomyces rimosus]|uniref:EF-hand domain-containing protein n=1 Tax=Streptomyces rimosus TaxID=1927 RepID=UPI0004CAD4B4|nr:EF-hand domain-containing protein [Streptomyces rimosus]